MLTRKQHELLMFIHERLKEAGVPPSFDEMKDALDLRSKSGIHRLIKALEERGFIKRLPNRARAIEVIRLPEFDARRPRAARRAASRRASSRAASAASGRSPTASHANEPVMVPVMGRIAAGTPIEAIQTHSHSIVRSAGHAVAGRAFRARGARRLDDRGRHLRRRHRAHPARPTRADTGDIVVALVDEEEATLKRLRRKGASIALEAANPAYETRIFGPDRVRIQGRLVGLIRRY